MDTRSLAPLLFAISIVFALTSPNAAAYAPANPDDAVAAQFFIRQCPGCTQTNLQYFNNQKRLALAKTKITLKPGFYTPDQYEIPAKVRQAAKAVFSLIVLNEDENAFPAVPTTELLEKFRKWSASADSQTRRVSQVAKVYYEKCVASGQAVCRAPLQAGAIAGGSGILIGEKGTELWTAGHVFEEPFRQALLRHGLTDVQSLVQLRKSFKVLMFDGEGQLVAHPFNNSLRLAYSASSRIILRVNPEIRTDNIRFELEHSLGRGLEVSGDIKPGANVYSVGYPACTGCAPRYGSINERLVSGTRFPYRDASNFDQQFTLGQVLEKSGSVVVTNADGHGGMSGGAALDEEGRVIGINSAVGVTLKSPDFLADRRLRLSRPAQWAELSQSRS